MPVKFIAFALSIKPLQVQNVLRIHKKIGYKLLEDKRLKLKNWKIKITPEKLELIIRKQTLYN